jgi:hypothetical protein
VVASSSTTGWAFDEEDTPAPVAYRHAGGNWSSFNTHTFAQTAVILVYSR